MYVHNLILASHPLHYWLFESFGGPKFLVGTRENVSNLTTLDSLLERCQIMLFLSQRAKLCSYVSLKFDMKMSLHVFANT